MLSHQVAFRKLTLANSGPNSIEGREGSSLALLRLKIPSEQLKISDCIISMEIC